MATHDRPVRVGHAFMRELSAILTRGLKDPRVKGLVTVTGTKMAPDLKDVTAYVSVLGEEAVRRETLEGLAAAAGYLQREVARRMKLRYVPHLRFAYDAERNGYVCRFRLGKRFTGPPGHCHGGIIATILDEAMGKVNKIRDVVAVTSEMTVNYVKPVPLNQPLRVESREESVHGRQHINVAQILNQEGEVLARSRGLFIKIDPQKMFGKFVER